MLTETSQSAGTVQVPAPVVVMRTVLVAIGHYAIRIIAVAAAGAGKMIVKSPAVEVLSDPKSRIAHAGFVRAVLALLCAEGVVL